MQPHENFQDHLEQLDRLMEIIRSTNPRPLLGNLTYYDALTFALQCMWHLKDWILNDPNFQPKDRRDLEKDIHSTKCLLICADLANGSKHLSLDRPKTDSSLSNRTGIHYDPTRGINQEFFYIACSDPSDPFHGMEIRELLSQCREAWDIIIGKHYLSELIHAAYEIAGIKQ